MMLRAKIYHILLFIVKYNHLAGSVCPVSVIVPQQFSDAKCSVSEMMTRLCCLLETVELDICEGHLTGRDLR
jgi:hypothetical protein